MAEGQTEMEKVQTEETTAAVEKGGEAVQESSAGNLNRAGKEDLERPVIDIDQLEEEREYSSEEFNEMVSMYEETMNEIKEGEIVKGKVLAVGEKEVTVDIGFKSEGVIPITEFDTTEELTLGYEIEVFLDSVEDKDGQLVLSKKKADFARIWEKIMEVHQKDEIIDGKCLRRIKGGIVVDLMGIDAFLPGSQIDVKPIRDFDAFIGQTLHFKIVKVNHLRKNIVVSRRVLIEEGQKEMREKILKELERGQILEGTVKNITDFGVFIDLGGVDGLLHITDLSWGRVGHPSEILQLDEKVKVMVLDFNDNKERISLGLKQLQPHPWENIESKYAVAQRIKGRVVSITDYGAFVELEKGIEGLIHISEMSWTQHIKHPSKLLSVGQEVEAVILNIEKDDKKISLGLKQIEPDPWDGLETRYPVGSRHTGIVRNITNFGVFVELEEGVDGLVHISDLSWTRKVRHPSEIVKKADEIEVVILNINRGERRISLGHKQIEDNPWDRFENIYKVGTETSGAIVRLIEKGAIVELPEKVEGFLPASQMIKRDQKAQEDQLKPGNELHLSVIEFDKNQKKIVLAEIDVESRREKEDIQEYMKTQKESSSGTTIGEAIGGKGEEGDSPDSSEAEGAEPAELSGDDKGKSGDEAGGMDEKTE